MPALYPKASMRALCTVALLTLAFGMNWAFAAPSFPTLTGRVVDNAGLLDPATKAQLSKQLEAHEAASSNQIVVATVSNLEGYDIADYGVQLARHWGIGTQDNSNGVVILVAPEERKVRIEVGYGLEGALPDGLAGDIIRKRILPLFRENDYPAGIQAGVSSVISAIDGEYQYTPSAKSSKDSSGINAIVPVGFISLMFLSHIARRKFNDRRLSQAIMPGGFVGMFVLIVSNNPFFGLAAGLLMFVFMFFIFFKHTGAKGNTNNGAYRQNLNDPRHNNRQDYGHRHGGMGGGGGFSGGGGGFGGGGASGGW